MRRIRGFVQDQRATSAVEYGLICALVVLAMFATFSTVAGKVVGRLNNVSNSAAEAL